MTGHDRRAAYIEGLIDLAQWLKANPDAPLPDSSSGLSHSVLDDDDTAGVEAVRAAAQVMGVQVKVTARGRQHIAALRFGPVVYKVVYCSAESMNRHYALASYRDSVQPEAVA